MDDFLVVIEALLLIIKDHRSLKWLQNQKDLTGRLGRWALQLPEYDFVIVYRPGSTNQNDDVMSNDLIRMQMRQFKSKKPQYK